MIKIFKWIASTALVIVLLNGCNDQQDNSSNGTGDFNVDFEQFELDNGLKVVFHIDRSDPVVAVALTSHVGSAREIAGRTGFAHLFEHLLFLESENLGKGGLDKLSARIGGSGANGSTSRDRTNYFQTVPKDALEKMIWAEADKLGYFINTVTEPVLAKEKQVVKNEKRQSVDNVPYGHANYVIDKNLYPEGHPYSWQVIGSLEDLQNATLQDVKDFYNRWYVPNNVTLVIAGDFDSKQAKTWVEKYFGEIERGSEVKPFAKQPVELKETKLLYHEDNFARLPELRMVWPTVYQYHPESYALNILTNYLSEGKNAPLNQVLIDDKKYTSRVSMFQSGSEIAGETYLIIRANPGQNLNDVREAVLQAFAKFEKEGISENDLERIKAQQETGFYNGLSSVLGKGFQLAQYQIFAGDPGFINQDIKNILKVSAKDVMDSYNKYVKNRPYVSTSFVPKGDTSLVLTGAVKAEVVEEKIIAGAEDLFDLGKESATYQKSYSSFDRSVEPPYGSSIEVVPPLVWKHQLSNKVKLFGIENKEVPLVRFSLQINGGHLLDSFEKNGVANLMARLMNKGTEKRDVAQLEEDLSKLGAGISVRASREDITISGNTLSRNFNETMIILTEMLLEPRWDSEEFELEKRNIINQLNQSRSRPNSIATSEFNKILYGDEHIYSTSIFGSEETVDQITIEDLKSFYKENMASNISSFHIVGDISKSEVIEALSEIEQRWSQKTVKMPDYENPEKLQASKVYFYDVPGAKQSVLRFGYLGPKATEADYFPASVMNYRLGGGGFASRLTQELREGKGYTYGIRSAFSGTANVGEFLISSGVRSNVTFESAALVKEILSGYQSDFNEKDLEVTKGFMIKSSARTFETLGAKLNMLENISNNGWKDDYIKERENYVKSLTTDEIKSLIKKYVRPDEMHYLIVGDAETQLERLGQLGFGKPELLNK